jgi:predicted CopG family antitoxin
MSCPNKNSKEWKDAMNRANGNEEEAMRIWTTEYDQEGDGGSEPQTDDIKMAQEEFEPEEKTDSFSDLVQRLRIYLQNKIEILQRTETTLKSEKIDELKKLQKNMSELENLESINAFVDYAFNQANQAYELMGKVSKKIQSGRVGRKEAIDSLVALLEYANNYNILDDIDASDIDDYFSGSVEEIMNKKSDQMTAQDKLTFAINTRNRIKSQVNNQGIELMADFLLDYAPESVEEKVSEQIAVFRQRIEGVKDNPKNKPEFIAKRTKELQDQINEWQNFTLDKANLIKFLKEAVRDEAIVDYLFTPLISSNDSVLALFARAVKTELEDARMKDIKIQRELQKAFDEYQRVAPGSRDNPKKFNEGIYEILRVPLRDAEGNVKRDESGNVIFMDRAAFVQKYDIVKFDNSRIEFYKNLGKRPRKGGEEIGKYLAEERKWYQENTQPLSAAERKEIIDYKKNQVERKIITEEEYNQWRASVVYENPDGSLVYMRELAVPSDKYISRKWTALYNENGTPRNAKGKYHKALTDLYFNQQDKIPEFSRNGYFLPSVLKTKGERMIDNLIKAGKTEFKEAFQFTANDYEFMTSTLSGEGAVKFIPIRYSEPMDASEVSLNLLRSVLLFSQSVNNFEALNGIHSETKLIKSIIGGRKVRATTSEGRPILDTVAKKLGYESYINLNGTPYSELHLDAFIDMIIYGEMRKKETLFGYNISKISDTIMSYSALTTLAADLKKGVANNLQANIQVIIEAASSEFIDFKNYAKGKAVANVYLIGGKFLKDFGKGIAVTLEGQIIEEFDPLQGEYKDMYGKTITGSLANKLFRTNTLFVNMHAGEYEIQTAMMFALMDREKVTDNETGKEMTLYQAYKKYGVDGVYDKTSYTKKQKLNLQNRLHALNKRMHGVYNSFDQSVAQRYTLGRLSLMYRKYLVPAYKKRFKRAGMDVELGAPTEGYYLTFWKTFIRDLRDFKLKVMYDWSGYSPFEKAQIKRTLYEVSFVLALYALVAALHAMAGDDDDLKKSKGYNHMLYQALRMRSETSAYLPVVGWPDLWRIVKSPSAATSSIDRFLSFIKQFVVGIFDDEANYYKRKTGPWKKGDSKTWAYFLKLMGYTGNTLNPDQAVKAFESSFFR